LASFDKQFKRWHNRTLINKTDRKQTMSNHVIFSRNVNNGPLSAERIKQLAPAVYSTTKAGRLTDRYVSLHTSDIIPVLADYGYEPVQAAQKRSRIAGAADHASHMVAFAKPMNADDGTGIRPEIILYNSHDGSSSGQSARVSFHIMKPAAGTAHACPTFAAFSSALSLRLHAHACPCAPVCSIPAQLECAIDFLIKNGSRRPPANWLLLPHCCSSNRPTPAPINRGWPVGAMPAARRGTLSSNTANNH
jgi:hypothetical protein